MADSLTVSEAARKLVTSDQTIRNLLHEGTLRGAKDQSGIWRIHARSVEGFLRSYGPLNGGRRRKSAFAALQNEAGQLRKDLALLTDAVGGQEVAQMIRERDDLRAQVVSVEHALSSMRTGAQLRCEAEERRSELIDHLLAAISASDRANRLSRQALQAYEDAIAGTAVPGHPGKAS